MKNDIPRPSSIRPVYLPATAIAAVLGVMTSGETCLVIRRTSRRDYVRRRVWFFLRSVPGRRKSNRDVGKFWVLVVGCSNRNDPDTERSVVPGCRRSAAQTAEGREEAAAQVSAQPPG